MDGLVYRGKKAVEVLGGGGLGGLLAGGAGLGLLSGWAWVDLDAPLLPVLAVGEAVLGTEAAPVQAVCAGAGLLVAAFLAWGVGFAAFVRSSTEPAVAGALGVPWALFAWALASWGLLPDGVPALLRLADAAPTGWLVSFLVAGAALGWMPVVQRRLLRAAMPRRRFVLVRGSGVNDSQSTGS